MKTKVFEEYAEPIVLEKYGLTVYGVWHVEADDDKVLVRRLDGKAIVESSLGVEFRDAEGDPLERPYIEQPEDYDEVLVEEYRQTHPEWIDPREEPKEDK